MRALVWDGATAAVLERPEPAVAPGRVLVRVAAAGICNTDLEIVRGYMGFRGVLGHEFTGTVVEGPEPWRGRRVVGEINFGCGHCEACRRGLRRHCPTRQVMGILDADGAITELVSVPVENLHVVPDELSDAKGVFTEPLAAAFEILEQVHVPPGRRSIVLGDGKLGLLVAQVLDLAGARVLAVGKHDAHLAFLRSRGIETVKLDDWDRAAADLVVEATGSAQGFGLAVSATRPRGTLVLKSTVADRTPLDLAPVVINEISVVGSRCGPFEPALRALASGAVSVEPLIARRLPLRDAGEGLQLAAQPGMLKVLIET